VAKATVPAVNTPQFDWALSRLPRKAQPIPPINEPEVAARAVRYAAGHPRRREYWVGGSTVATLMTNKFAPGLLDRYLARTAYSSQQNQRPRGPRQPVNRWQPADAPGGHGFGARDRFTNRSSEHSLQLWASHRHGLLGAAAATAADHVGQADQAGHALARSWLRRPRSVNLLRQPAPSAPPSTAPRPAAARSACWTSPAGPVLGPAVLSPIVVRLQAVVDTVTEAHPAAPGDAARPAAAPVPAAAPPRWSADQVLSLAPDTAAQHGARATARDTAWGEAGLSSGADLPPTLWGLVLGSGSRPYQTCVDLTEPAYRCSCPSRKFPCKHTLALLLRWSAGAIPEAPAPAWVREWQASQAERVTRAAARTQTARTGGDGVGRAAGGRASARRAGRVASGMAELDRWLSDQVRGGLATAAQRGYEHWDAMGARLVDAQAPGAARLVRSLAGYLGDPDRLLAEIGLLRLLCAGYSRLDALPPALAAVVRLRVGLPVAAEEVLAGEPVRDLWQVLGVRDEPEDNLMVRRVWLRGAASGRAALVLSFAGPGQVFATDLIPGTGLDADLCFYPEHLRVLIARRHAPARPLGTVAGSLDVAGAMAEYARALAADPWLERWPMVLAGVVPAPVGAVPAAPVPGGAMPASGAGGGTGTDGAHDAPAGGGRQRWCLTAGGAGVPLDPAAGPPWRLVAAASGRPVTVAGEWTAAGLRPLSVWARERLVTL
jgi:hypothetical protein